MRDQHALDARLVDLDMCLDGVAAAAHVGRDVGQHVTHAGVKDKVVPRALESRGILRKARAAWAHAHPALMRELVLTAPQMAAGSARPNCKEVRRRALAKAGTELVEGRTLAADLLDPLRELQENLLSH